MASFITPRDQVRCMEPKKGIDHEAVGIDVSKREDERQDITNVPPERATGDRPGVGDPAGKSSKKASAARDEDEVADEIPGARDDDGTETTG